MVESPLRGPLLSTTRVPLPKFVGARVTRREDPALVTGGEHYVADVPLPGALHMAVLRSPYAHARVAAIDGAAALATPGVAAVVTAADLGSELHASLPVEVGAPGGRYGEVAKPPRQLLAGDRVRFVGEPVAVLLAEDAGGAADALGAIRVDWEPLPVVTDAEAALAESAPRLHDLPGGNRAFEWSVSGGEPERAFAEAREVVELRVRIQRLIPNAMEPRAVAARVEPETGRLVVWSSTQVPHQLRDDLAAVLDVPPESLRVIAPAVGGGFGAKVNVYAEEILVPLLARRLGRPVRWVASRSEDYQATVHGRGMTATVRLAADADGRLRGASLDALADCGAYYSRVTPAVVPFTGLMLPGVYDVPSLGARAVAAFTNKAPIEPYRGAGRPEAAYLIERAMDVLARRLQLDPAELRRRNFVPPDRFPYRNAAGLEYDSGDYARALDQALANAGYAALREEQARRRAAGGRLLGIGLSCYVEICGFGPWESGTVHVRRDGSVLVLTGTSPQGQGHATSWAQIAADALQVPMESVEVRAGDTGVVREGIGTFGSRSAPVGGSAIFRSAELVRERGRRLAAHLLEAPVDDVTLGEGRFHVVGVPARAISWREAAAAAEDEATPAELRGALRSEQRFAPPGETYPFGAHVAVVEVDPETGEVELRRFVTADDCGRVINPLLVEGQVHGGIAQGVAQALWEEALYDESGNLVSGSLMDYALPKAEFFPPFETSRTETPTPLNPLGVKGIGEAATIGSTPAVVNAVVDALAHLGVDHLDTPLTPERVWRALRRAASG